VACGPRHSRTAAAKVCFAAVAAIPRLMSSQVPQTAPPRKVLEKIGKYVVVNEVGRGSTGIVYLSHDAYYGRDVAIKVYNMDSGGDDERARIARKMFLSEAHLVGMLQHPHILALIDSGDTDGLLWYVMPYVEGESLMMGIKNLAVSSGSACTSASLEPSYVLRALGVEEEMAHTSLRIGLGRFTTEHEVDTAVDELVHHVNKLREMSPLWEMAQEGIDIKSIEWAAH